MKGMKRPWPGFTLIELLIVVAIIAILAAIAVPNFLEAQVRSKISRVKSDLRTIGIAVESYVIDHNCVLGSNEFDPLPGVSTDEARLMAFARLSTPVAYLTSMPTDPFWANRPSGGVRGKAAYEYRSYNRFSAAGFRKCRNFGFTWAVNSIGPHIVRYNDPGMQEVLDRTAPLFVYDPSNGTTSKGFIIRTNKGEYNSR